MKRLTHPGDYCEDIAQCGKGASCCGPNGCRNKQFWEKLRAYEDTGLSPEEVAALMRRLTGTDRDVSGLLEE